MQALARLATTERLRPIHYASTLSVFVATDRNAGVVRPNDDLGETREVYGGYAQSKYVAERYLRALGDGGLPVTLQRASTLARPTMRPAP